MDPGLIENSVLCYKIWLFLFPFSSLLVSEFCSLLPCVVFTTRLGLYVDTNSSTHRVNHGKSFPQSLSTALGAKEYSVPPRVPVDGHGPAGWIQSSVPGVWQAPLGAVGSHLSHVVCWLGWLHQMPAASSSSPCPE